MTKTQPVTKKDIKRLEKRIEKTEEKGISNQHVRKSLRAILKRIDAFQEHIEKLLTDFKEEILRHINGTMKELETSREEQIIVGQQLTEHEEKLENHEKRITHLEAV